MNTIVIGICEVNFRRYFVGIWPDIETCRKNLAPLYKVSEELPIAFEDKWGPEPQDYNAIRAWGADDTGMDSEESFRINPEVSYIGSEADCFSLYEIPVDELPGFMGFDED